LSWKVFFLDFPSILQGRGIFLITQLRFNKQLSDLKRMCNHSHCSPMHVNHSVNSSSHGVNGDIAIQWEWSNFDPSQNPNPLTDYDKTLHKTNT